ncbi:MAG: hypothetical protein ACP5J4_19930 [Anaerolineae bacterium]
MVAVPEAPLEGSSSVSTENRPMLFMTEDDGASDLRAALFSTVESAVVNGQRLGVLAVGVVNEPDTVTTYNVTLTSANTEYSQALPSGCRAVAFRCRTGYAVRFAWETGKVATPTAPYQTLKAGGEYWKDNINADGLTLYLASDTAAVIVEIEVWS